MGNSSGYGTSSKGSYTVNKECTFCGVVNNSAEKCFKNKDTKRKNLEQLVIWTTYEQNGRIRNVFDVDLKIT